MKPAPRTLAAQLWALKNGGLDQKGIDEIAALASSGRTSIPVDTEVAKGLYRSAGFRVCGGRAVRVDILERLADLIRPAMSYVPGQSVGEPPTGAAEGDALRGHRGDDLPRRLRRRGLRPDPENRSANVSEERPGPAITSPIREADADATGRAGGRRRGRDRSRSRDARRCGLRRRGRRTRRARARRKATPDEPAPDDPAPGEGAAEDGDAGRRDARRGGSRRGCACHADACAGGGRRHRRRRGRERAGRGRCDGRCGKPRHRRSRPRPPRSRWRRRRSSSGARAGARAATGKVAPADAKAREGREGRERGPRREGGGQAQRESAERPRRPTALRRRSARTAAAAAGGAANAGGGKSQGWLQRAANGRLSFGRPARRARRRRRSAAGPSAPGARSSPNPRFALRQARRPKGALEDKK